MSGILIFGGTVEGRELAGYLSGRDMDVAVCVVSGYGAALLPPSKNLHVHVKAMDLEEIRTFIKAGGYKAAVDATHPYARQVTENLREACRVTDTPYIRLLRPSQPEESARAFESVDRLVAYLQRREGPILLTTGSRDLHRFTVLRHYADRIFPRMLPTVESIQRAESLGFKSKNLICMHGPFSVEMNVATLRLTGARFLVTKDSAAAGGVPEKREAAETTGAELLLVGRPKREDGLTLEQVKEELEKNWISKE